MKIIKSKANIEYINSLIDIKELSISLNELYLSLFSNRDIANKDEIEALAKKYNKSTREVFLDKVLSYWEIDLDYEDNQELFEKYIEPNFLELEDKDYKNNPYFKNIKIEEIKEKDYELKLDRYEPYEVFPVNDLYVNEDFIEINTCGYFKDRFEFITLNHKGTTWMNITPNEINTMSCASKKARGDVIIFGLGLGYFPYIISLKNEVKSITIIEKDSHIIDIFNKYLLPQFEQKSKIKIINCDAYNIIKSPLNYDFAFVDLWHNPDDGIEIFLDFKRNEHLSPKCEFSYWIERSFYAYLRRIFIALLYEQLNDFDEKTYQFSTSTFEKIINKYYKNTKNITLKTKDDIIAILSDDSLLKLVL